jgi:hypothetical protein
MSRERVSVREAVKAWLKDPSLCTECQLLKDEGRDAGAGDKGRGPRSSECFCQGRRNRALFERPH